jgi:hypothetical protein
MIRVFFSYSRADESWVQEGPYGLVPWLARALRRHEVTFWADPALRELPGVNYAGKITEEIRQADFALLLISQDFINSDFICQVELPLIRERVEREELAIIPVLVGPTLWEGAEELRWLAARQMLPGKPTPLIEYTREQVSWQNVRIEILQAIISRIRESRGVRGTAPPPDSTIGQLYFPLPAQEQAGPEGASAPPQPQSASPPVSAGRRVAPRQVPDLPKRYRLEAEMATADFGAVYRAFDEQDGVVVAVKVTDLTRSLSPVSDAAIVADHPRIARYRASWESEQFRYEVMDFVPGWPLQALVAANPNGFGGGWVGTWAGELLNMIAYLHGASPPIVHRDIKPANLIVQAPDRYLVLIDTSLATHPDPGGRAERIVSRGYSAPELYRGRYSEASDVYSWGATVFALATGQPPPDAPLREVGRELPGREVLERCLAGSFALRALDLDPIVRGRSSELLRELRAQQEITRYMPPLNVWLAGNFPPLDPELGVLIRPE